MLQLKGGTGAGVPPFLKKIGLLNSDGTPTPLYEKLRNPATAGAAVAEAMRIGFRPLFEVNEYAQRLNDNDLKGLILQVTGLEKDNRVAALIFGTFKKLKSHANFDAPQADTTPMQGSGNGAGAAPPSMAPITTVATSRGLNLSYTINLNLPATTNIEVFNAIFRSLREHILDD